MNKKEELESKLKELKLQKRQLVLANKNTDNIDQQIKEIEMEIESVAEDCK